MTAIFFKLLGFLHNIYPIKRFMLERAEEYLFNYHIKQVLDEASKAYPIGEYWDVRDLIYMSPFRGMLSELVRASEFYPTPKDIAVAINISISAYCNEKYINKDNIIDLSFHLSQEIKSRFISDQLLKIVFEDLNKDLDKFLTVSERSDIDSLFFNKKDLFMYYYSTFSKPEYSCCIKIWHQSQTNEFIDWKEDNAITVNLNSLRIREGFFQTGFDYYCLQSETALQYATRYQGFESFNGCLKGDVVWAR